MSGDVPDDLLSMLSRIAAPCLPSVFGLKGLRLLISQKSASLQRTPVPSSALACPRSELPARQDGTGCCGRVASLGEEESPRSIVCQKFRIIEPVHLPENPHGSFNHIPSRGNVSDEPPGRDSLFGIVSLVVSFHVWSLMVLSTCGWRCGFQVLRAHVRLDLP